jgi:hypothetical protein
MCLACVNKLYMNCCLKYSQHITDLPTELLVGEDKAFQPYGKLHITTPHHILNLEV